MGKFKKGDKIIHRLSKSLENGEVAGEPISYKGRIWYPIIWKYDGGFLSIASEDFLSLEKQRDVNN